MASKIAHSQEPDRDTSHAYLEWLTMEARLLQEELFPAADHSRQLAPCNTFSKGFHFPVGRSWREVPPPSSRAEAVLRTVGVEFPNHQAA
ncbi:hypothetical protein [Phyllobacterium chamaecytisi]|uniref:hypothetical protein n=1 Tax=Phyllobacterium chamaecytisi TaxID=2876082 RepID=UPI001CC916F8|nr:hypothetical protein [Phyllobacterium sp. KW56]MBZ9600488.1 hypothetical protein [Phyllobacterium sp. KW56]